MAVPLVAILAFVAYDRYGKDGAPDDGWKVYRNQRFRFELRLPPAWEIRYENEQANALAISFTDPANRADLVDVPYVLVGINPAMDWCVSDRPVIESRDITVSGVRGAERICFLLDGTRWSVLRDFTKDGNRVWVVGLVPPKAATAPAQFPAVLKVVQSFRFVD
jgi:hypothetical protein